MKIVKDTEEIEIGEDIMNLFLDSSAKIITDGLLSKFVEQTGIVLKANSLVPICRDYCKVGKFITDKDDFKTSFDVIEKILDSETPYIEFKTNIDKITIIDPKLKQEWKSIIDQQLFQKAIQGTMFS